MSASLHEGLLTALVASRGVLILGPAFAHGVAAIEPNALLEQLRAGLPEGAEWEGLRPADRMELLVEARGAEGVARALAEGLPTAEALRGSVGDFQRRLLSLPFPIIVSVGLDDLAAATLAELGAPHRVVTGDADLGVPGLPGERLLVKLRDDPLLGVPRLTRAAQRGLPRAHPRLIERLRGEARAGAALLYGFGPRSESLRWVFEDVLDAPSVGCHLALRSGSALWAGRFEHQGLEVTASATVADLEAAMTRLADRLVQVRPRLTPESAAALVTLDAEVVGAVQRRLTGLPCFGWAVRARGELDALGADALPTVLDGLGLLEAVADRGLRPPGLPAARAAEVLARLGRADDAWRALRLAVPTLDRSDAVALGSVGRALSRLGEEARARPYLEGALTVGDADDPWARVSDLAWLAKSVLHRIDALRAAHRKRAVTEVIARFLSAQAPRLRLSALDPGEDVDRAWSVYYVNLRLGRVMLLASEMAQASGRVYAEQAVELLTRAIELAPHKPDPYKAVRPLLTDRRWGVADARRWMGLVAAAPAEVQKRLTHPKA
jgi:tetratricopeptide (TPR) repeat protein